MQVDKLHNKPHYEWVVKCGPVGGGCLDKAGNAKVLLVRSLLGTSLHGI